MSSVATTGVLYAQDSPCADRRIYQLDLLKRGALFSSPAPSASPNLPTIEVWTACPAGGRVRPDDGGIPVCVWLSRRKETGMKEAGAALSMLLLLGALLAAAQDASGPSIWSGVFTAEQAKIGRASCRERVGNWV